ncbi:hypothetical protein ABZ470_17220 [Streptosporangium sp. NPDC020072]
MNIVPASIANAPSFSTCWAESTTWKYSGLVSNRWFVRRTARSS